MWKKIIGNNRHRGLVPRYDGSFEVIGKAGVVAYKPKLPERLKLQPTFHVSYLKPFHEVLEDLERSRSLTAPPTIKKQFEQRIVKIMEHKRLGQHKKNHRTKCLVK